MNRNSRSAAATSRTCAASRTARTAAPSRTAAPFRTAAALRTARAERGVRLGRTVRRNLAMTATAAALAGAAALSGGAPPAARAGDVPPAATRAAATVPVRTVAEASAACAPGELCLWEKQGYTGARHTHELASTDIESCIVVPGGGAQSFANRTGRPVTTYQSAECQETGEFDTYPGKGQGTWSPEAPYRVRAFKIWER